jgi:hypothetical protein
LEETLYHIVLPSSSSSAPASNHESDRRDSVMARVRQKRSPRRSRCARVIRSNGRCAARSLHRKGFASRVKGGMTQPLNAP